MSVERFDNFPYDAVFFTTFRGRDLSTIVVQTMGSGESQYSANVYYNSSCQTNSSVIDDRIIELLAQLAEMRVTENSDEAANDSKLKWNDVGIFSLQQWTTLVNKCLGSFRKYRQYSPVLTEFRLQTYR